MLERQAPRPDPAALQPLVWLLRSCGAIDLLAAVAVVMPRAWMQLGCEWTGLEPFPEQPLAGYLARSASALYALHGVLVLAMSCDVLHYWKLLRLLAFVAVGHGLLMVGIDLAEEMPLWWTLVEGPTFSVTGLLVLAAQRYAVTRPQTVP